MITAVHTLIYSDDPTATRDFLKDVLRWPFVAEPGRGDEGRRSGGDSGSQDPADWLIFATGPSELGVHPTQAGDFTTQRHHEIALVCDDIEATVAELTGRGATFTSGPTDMGFGLAAFVQVPGADDLMIYQPKHVTAYDNVS